MTNHLYTAIAITSFLALGVPGCEADPSPTPEPSAPPSPSPQPPTPNPGMSPSSTVTPSPTASKGPTSTRTPTPEATPSPTPTPTQAAIPTPTPEPSSSRILLFTRTSAFRHGSIGSAVPAITAALEAKGHTVTHSEDNSLFTASGLSSFDTIVFLLTSGDILEAEQQAAFEAWFEVGKGWAGIHSAADTEYNWPFYGDLLGAYFNRHPATQEGHVDVEDGSHPATLGLESPWIATDEWYDFRTDPRESAHILLTVDESTYSGGGMGADHPIAWCHERLGGRSFYSALGHPSQRYGDAQFIAHLVGGIEWAGGLRPEGACPTP